MIELFTVVKNIHIYTLECMCGVFPLFSYVYYHIVTGEFCICLITVLTLISNEYIISIQSQLQYWMVNDHN